MGAREQAFPPMIRKAVVDDAPLLARLNRDVQQMHTDAVPEVYKRPAELDVIAQDFREGFLLNPNALVLIIEADGQGCGYLAAVISQRPDSPYTYAQKRLHVDQIGVQPADQGKGYGRALMNAAIAYAYERGCDVITLDVAAFNSGAVAFYRRLGFEQTMIRMNLGLDERTA